MAICIWHCKFNTVLHHAQSQCQCRAARAPSMIINIGLFLFSFIHFSAIQCHFHFFFLTVELIIRSRGTAAEPASHLRVGLGLGGPSDSDSELRPGRRRLMNKSLSSISAMYMHRSAQVGLDSGRHQMIMTSTTLNCRHTGTARLDLRLATITCTGLYLHQHWLPHHRLDPCSSADPREAPATVPIERQVQHQLGPVAPGGCDLDLQCSAVQ